MDDSSYRFKLGAFECLAVSDGYNDYPLKSFFANVPLAEVEAALRERGDPDDVIRTPYTYLVVETGTHRVLVDTGAGGLLPETGHLVDNLRAAGIAPTEIDAVVITHAHGDHVGGALDDAGRSVFAQARYYVSQREWAFWTSEGASARAPERFVALARQALEGIRKQVTLIDREGEILPGIDVLFAPGHTPGQVVASISSGGKRLLYTADVVLHPLHLEHTEWTPVYDLLPDEAMESKRRIYDLAAESGALVLGQHFHPFPSLGHVIKHGNGWRWQSIEAA